MSDITSSQLKYWNGMLSTGNANPYCSVVNYDIVAPSYSWYGQKQRNTSFYYKKRKGYNDILPCKYSVSYRDWDVSDIVQMNSGACDEGECLNYIMLTNQGSGVMKVLVQECGDCDRIFDLLGGTGIQQVGDIGQCSDFVATRTADECFCPCQYDQFLVTDFVKGAPRIINPSNGVVNVSGIQENVATGTVGQFYDETIKYFDNVKVGDWVYVISSPNDTGDAVCAQARQVVSIDYRTAQRDYDILILNGVWTGLDANKGINATYSIYPEWGDVVVYATCDGLRIIHTPEGIRNPVTQEVSDTHIANVTTVCSSFQGSICTYGLNEYGNSINILGSQGRNMFGGLAYDKFNFSADNINYVGEDKISQTTFRNFLVQFGRENIGVIAYDSQGNSFSYKLDGSIGIFSKNAYASFQNSLYILGSDKRLYAAEIASNGMNGYMLNLTDQSALIKGDLELLQEGDDVSIAGDGKHIYLFINNKADRRNSNNTKTRILKYYRDYNKRVTHDVCCAVINRHKNGYFLGDGIYINSYLDRDCMDYEEGSNEYLGGKYINAYIEAVIGENEDGQVAFTTFSYKKLKWMKMLLGKGIYTDGATKIVIDYGSHGYQQQYQIDKFEHIDWITKNNQIRQGGEVTPDACILESLAECTNVVRPCKGQPQPFQIDSVGCRTFQTGYMDNCMCLDDRSYALSDIYNVFVNLNHLKKSELFRIKIMSTGGDEMVFGGIMLGVDIYDIAAHDGENLDVLNNGSDCCTEGEFIDVNDPCPCS